MSTELDLALGRQVVLGPAIDGVPTDDGTGRYEGLKLVDVGAHITSVMNSMLGLSSYTAHRSDFLSTVSLDSDLTPLQDAGYNTASINKGIALSG